ncbi:arginine N-succinyltransferase [Aromatoleum toluclasticum]|uniref:arginine N-succinyltransferase n=1 Tax=Aromatoleum toluclasticum TaxID=92003 RepID=UPI001D1975B6|nr:arginine N-succinyltransferase [Aromatoleum toluclasticum]MCC4115810.1 arginine N-succinyltransferase [Aromatoleum toluclasticum]
MLTIRPAQHSDLDALVDIAARVAAPDVSLPNDPKVLERLVAQSEDALADDIGFPSEEQYLLVATGNGALLGAMLVVAAAGHPGADYSFRNETIIHASPELGVNHRMYALTLSHDLSGFTLLRPPLVARGERRAAVERALLRAALAFIAEHPARFAEDLIAPLPGMIDDDGESPFWSAVGSKFFGVSYREAERLALGKDRSFMAELMPHHPIYVPLLPEWAQNVLGQTRADYMSTYGLLIDEGFEAERYVDVFDGGPTFNVKRELARSIHLAQTLPLAVDGSIGRSEPECLLANREAGRFRAVLAPALRRPDGRIATTAEAANKLELIDDDEVRCVLA